MNHTIDIQKETSLGDLVTYFPPITRKLNELNIDYCCKGNRSIQQAMEESGLPAGFLGELREAYHQYLQSPNLETPAAQLSDQDLIDLILEEHHFPERELLQELDGLVNKILRAHYNEDKEMLLDLHRQFGLLKMDLEEHFIREERELFPAILSSGSTLDGRARISSMISELEGEHDQTGRLVRKIGHITNEFTPPDYACVTMQAVYRKLHELVDDLFVHIAKENSVLFKRYL